MKCPFCKNNNTTVSYTRRSASSIRRRRICTDCSSIFFTKEEVLPVVAYVIKKDGRKEPFNEVKILKSLTAAGFKRPSLKKALPDLVEKTKNQILLAPKQTLTAEKIAQLILDDLKKLDRVAYLRFASVQNPSEVEGLLKMNKLPSDSKTKSIKSTSLKKAYKSDSTKKDDSGFRIL